jgi:hypothetical protein
MSGNCRYVPPPIASQTSITSTVPMTNANTSLTYSDKSRHLSLVTGNLTTSLRPAYWTFVQSPADRVLPCAESRADPLRRADPRSALRCRTRSSPPCLGASASRTAPSRPPSLGDRSLLRSRQRSSLRHVAPGPRVAGSRVRPRQDRGGVVTFAAVLAATGCAGIALVLTGWQFLAVHAHVRAPPAPYWVCAPLPRTTPRPWARVGPSDETGRCRLWT